MSAWLSFFKTRNYNLVKVDYWRADDEINKLLSSFVPLLTLTPKF